MSNPTQTTPAIDIVQLLEDARRLGGLVQQAFPDPERGSSAAALFLADMARATGLSLEEFVAHMTQAYEASKEIAESMKATRELIG